MTLGLRAKSALVLLLCIAVVLALAAAAGWQALNAIEGNLGVAFARNVTRYNKQRILTPILRELALSQRLADSEITRRWLLDENNAEKRQLFFAEAERYRGAFADHSYSVASHITRHYYYNDARSIIQAPRNTLVPGKASDAWFFSTMQQTRDFNLNVERDEAVNRTKVWINVVVKDGTRKLGIAGTGLDLTTFLKRFITTNETGVTLMILNEKAAIQAHPDPKLIDYASINDKGASHRTIYQLLKAPGDEALVRHALEQATKSDDQIPFFTADINGRHSLGAVSFIPELKWYVVTAVNLKAANVIDRKLWLPPLFAGGALLVLLVLVIIVAVNRIVLTPLLKLTASVRAVGAGDYAVDLPPAGNDELGELTRAFGAMAAQVRSHTDELESKVRERTSELVAVNEQMADANKKIGDSIQYASLIQNAILPNREMERALAASYFVLWHPRDVVGGDFYVFRANEQGYLIGVVDCAGHGVPGAFMTMIANTVLNNAMDTLGLDDPAALLAQMDEKIRASLQADSRFARVATHMDAGLAYVDFQAKTVTFAGAKISLYWCDGASVGEIKGERYAIGDKRQPVFSNRSQPLDPRVTFYLTTDGLLDQAGGPKGYSFGVGRFAALLRRHATRPFAEQRAALAEELAVYQGGLAQRDDITVLSFRFTGS